MYFVPRGTYKPLVPDLPQLEFPIPQPALQVLRQGSPDDFQPNLLTLTIVICATGLATVLKLLPWFRSHV